MHIMRRAGLSAQVRNQETLREHLVEAKYNNQTRALHAQARTTTPAISNPLTSVKPAVKGHSVSKSTCQQQNSLTANINLPSCNMPLILVTVFEKRTFPYSIRTLTGGAGASEKAFTYVLSTHHSIGAQTEIHFQPPMTQFSPLPSNRRLLSLLMTSQNIHRKPTTRPFCPNETEVATEQETLPKQSHHMITRRRSHASEEDLGTS